MFFTARKTTSTLFIATIVAAAMKQAFVSASCRARYCWLSYANFRVSQQYSTSKKNFDLITPGTTFEISLSDSFDFVPAVGYGNLTDVKEEVEGEVMSADPHVLMKGYDSIVEWAKIELDDQALTISAVPMPKESLPGKELTVKGAVELHGQGPKVVCHEVEHETYFCHKVDNLSVTAIDVVPTVGNGKSSTLWAACHEEYEMEKEENRVGCHVMNVNDLIFTGKSQFGENVKRIQE